MQQLNISEDDVNAIKTKIINTYKIRYDRIIDSNNYYLKLMDSLFEKGVNKGANIVELQILSPQYSNYIEDILDNKLTYAFGYTPDDGMLTAILTSIAILAGGTYKLYKLDVLDFFNKQIIELNNNFIVDILILNGTGLSAMKRENDFSYVMLEKFLPCINDNSIIIYRGSGNDFCRTLLKENNFIKKEYFYATT